MRRCNRKLKSKPNQVKTFHFHYSICMKLTIFLALLGFSQTRRETETTDLASRATSTFFDDITKELHTAGCNWTLSACLRGSEPSGSKQYQLSLWEFCVKVRYHNQLVDHTPCKQCKGDNGPWEQSQVLCLCSAILMCFGLSVLVSGRSLCDKTAFIIQHPNKGLSSWMNLQLMSKVQQSNHIFSKHMEENSVRTALKPHRKKMLKFTVTEIGMDYILPVLMKLFWFEKVDSGWI